MVSVGINKDYQASPYGQGGGLNTFPAAGIISGLSLSLGGTAGVGTPNTSLAVVVSAGAARFNGVRASAASNLTVSLPTGINLSTTNTVLEVYLNAPRKAAVYKVGASAPSGTEGAHAIRVIEVTDSISGTYQIVDELMIYKSGSWVALDPFSEIPQEYGFNGLPFNDTTATLTTANISLTNEVPIFLKTSLPPHVANGGLPLLRQSAGIFLGEVTFTGGVGAITKTTPNYHLLNV